MNALGEMGPYLSLSWQMIITIVLFVLLGYWLDQKFETKPLLTVILSLAGAGIGFYNFIRTVLQLSKKKK